MRRPLTHLAASVLIAGAVAGCGGGSLGGRAGMDGSVAIGGASGIGTGQGSTSGAPGGFTGGGGVAGTGASSGSGGPGGAAGGDALAPCPFLQMPVCGVAACGNGRRDTCLTQLGPGCLPGVVTEACDGDDMTARVTCAELGYPSGGGAICAPDCSGLDLTGCHECLPPQAPLAACGSAQVGRLGQTVDVALAATDAEAAFAWLEGDDTGDQSLGFARLGPNVDTIQPTILERRAGTGGYGIGRLAVAPLPSGWVVAAVAASELYLHVLDAQGRPVARTPVDTFRYPVFATPIFAARPDGGPLVLWRTQYGGRGAVIAADGRSVSAPFDLPSNGDFPFAAWVQGAFTALLQPYDYIGAKLLRVDSDGRVMSTVDMFADEQVQLAGMAAGESEVRVLFRAQSAAGDTALHFQRFSPTGQPRNGRKLVADSRLTYHYLVPIVARGDDTALLLNQGGALDYGWLTADGDLTPETKAIAAGPNEPSPILLVRRGRDLVAAWAAYDAGSYASMHIGVARLLP